MQEMFELAERLFPICRSITGNGVRRSISILNDLVPINELEFNSGSKVFDWTIPDEWNIEDAYVADLNGKRIIDFKKSNLHLVSYSVPIDTVMKGREVKKHIHTLPDMPDAIPYLTSYYSKYWGFCLEHQRLVEIEDDKEYRVVVDSSLKSGKLTIGEGFIEGKSKKEILFSTYLCHPSMANNEISGPVVQSFLYKYLLSKQSQLKYSYRFLYLPETIGSITYLANFGESLKQNLKAGYVVTCIGDKGNFTYKRSRLHNSLADRAAINVLRSYKQDYNDISWFPSGSDERQYCSLAFNLPVGSLMRTMYAKYPEYHTSKDDLSLMSEQSLQQSLQAYIDIVENLEINDCYLNTNPECEPQLGKRGLYPNLGSQIETENAVEKIMYMLAYCDGKTDLIEIADKLNLKASDFKNELASLVDNNLLKISNSEVNDDTK